MSPETVSPPPRSERRSNSTVGGVLLLTFGVLASIIGSALLTGGIIAGGGDGPRDGEGYFGTPSESFATDTYALTSPELGRITGQGIEDLPFDLATVRLRASSGDSPVFIGIASRTDIAAYLENVEVTEIRSVEYRPFEVGYRDTVGLAAPEEPGRQDIWIASSAGPGTQSLEWAVAEGDWGIVVMNADASPGVIVDLDASVRSDLIAPAATALLILGAVLLLIGIPMVVLGAVLLGRATAAGDSTGNAAGTLASARTTRAVQLTGLRDPHLSRWLWIVKGILAIPHYVVLVFLWIAFAVTTVIAGFAILITGRYPHSLFDFNVGVLRWSWRVGFYSFSALGTDNYPPFTLAHRVYPADLEVAYPERLNRGLVLVKWWLLAIPHYLILAAIGAPLLMNRTDGFQDETRTGLSLVGVLILIAGVALLVTTRYPRGLFDLLVGISRWSYRVIVYAALLSDEYPPFRLDQGPEEPGGPDAPRPPAGDDLERHPVPLSG